MFEQQKDKAGRAEMRVEGRYVVATTADRLSFAPRGAVETIDLVNSASGGEVRSYVLDADGWLYGPEDVAVYVCQVGDHTGVFDFRRVDRG